MHIHVKRSIIAGLMLCSGAIFTSLVFANEQTELSKPYSHQLPAQPTSTKQCEAKSYLFECEDQSWLKETLNNLETFQVWLGGYVQTTSEGVDNYFGSDDAFDLAKGSRLDIMLPMVIHRSGQVELRVKTRAKIALPRLKRSWHLLISSEDSGLNSSTNNELVSERFEENNQALLGLQALLDSSKNNEISLDFGVKFDNIINLNPFIRLKKRSEWRPVKEWKNRMINTLFWEKVDGIGFNTKVVVDKSLSQPHLFRSQTEGTLWQNESYYDVTQRFLFYQTLNNHRVITYQVWSQGDSLSGQLKKTAYGLNVNWRERAYKNWLYFDVQPGVEWNAENRFERADVTLLLMLEMRFFKKRP